MKKLFCCIFALIIMPSMAFAQEALTLDEALNSSAIYLKDRIDPGAKIVVLNFQSDYIDLSNYIIDETIVLLVNLGNLTVVDRQNLETIRQEIDFQMSGEVSDESAQSIGRKLGAQIIVSGAIAPLGDLYRLRIRAIEVETAAILGINSQTIKLDTILASLTQNKAYRSPAAPRPAKTSNAKDFALDGKTRFGFSASVMYGTGWGAGGTVTVFEKFFPNFYVAPSIFISAKYFSDDSGNDIVENFFAGGVGILFKQRLTKNERLLFSLGFSLEYIAGEAETTEDGYTYDNYNDAYYYYSNKDVSGYVSEGFDGLLGLGAQGGFSYRFTPAMSLDINGLVKFGFGSVDLPDPSTGGIEIGVSYMF